ncbi:undecaprenyl-diphosphate phosphatase [Streptomyces sp. YIM 98790]|uniref:undecaprenyl-diphosphate phosphatase n=1 Tax=Streptomyces sp. YIM 98790 TaxID=2689077 RepID=UPI0014096039|nr:undecaprenyl-diphosphate phosphatase [Streptomyces sp. YIM 98790]
MSWFEALVLGLVQGLTEFLPVSSSAHLRLTALAAGWEDPGAAFTAVTQLGTELGILIYFRRDIWNIVSAWARSLVSRRARGELSARLGWLVILGSLPIGVLGVMFKDAIEGPFRDLRLIAASFIVLGIALGIADRIAAQAEDGGRHRAGRPRKQIEQLGVRDGVIFGLWQALALIPGMSRSGVTMTGGLYLGYSRAAAARYSFLLAIPAVLASGLYEVGSIGGAEAAHVRWPQTVFATAVSFVVGYAVIAWFMKWISTRTFAPFVWYRILAGLAILALVWSGAVEPMEGAGWGG